MDYRLILNDSDVSYQDDISNNIRVDRSFFEDPVEVESKVFIHYNEDLDNITHEYVVLDVNEEFVNLKWLTKLNESINEDLLTEANPFAKVKNALKNRNSEENVMKRAANKADKAQKKQDKKTVNLVGRDLAEGSGWTFYLQLPDETHIKQPLKYKDVSELYRNNLIGPWIKNAIVVDNYGNVVRCGGEDYYLDGTKYTPSIKLNSMFSVDWSEQDKENFTKIIEALPENSNLRKAVVANNSKENGSKSKINLDDKVIDKFRKVALLTGLKVVDKTGKEVDIKTTDFNSNETGLMTLKINNNEVNLLAWLRKYGKTLTESMIKSLCEDIDDFNYDDSFDEE